MPQDPNNNNPQGGQDNMESSRNSTHSSAPNSTPSATTTSSHHANNKLEKKKSNRSIRSPLIPNHTLSRQRSTNNTNHHRQYVLLRDKQGQNQSPGFANIQSSSTPVNTSVNSPLILSDQSNVQSPLLTPVQSSSISLQHKPKPYLKKQPSSKYIFSVDDNEDEIEEDLNREYLEGYNDGLRQRFKTSNNLHSLALPTVNDEMTSPILDKRNEVENDLIQATKDLRELKDLEADHLHQRYEESLNSTHSHDTQGDTDENQNLDDDNGDNCSMISNESFTLRERQVAINETHPFGIRIWKPAIYKKDRSVQKEAENDIHCSPGSKPKIGFSVTLFNYIWSLTFGLIIAIICFILAAITFAFSTIVEPKNKKSLQYAKFYWNLGKYSFYPFGKIVILKTEKRYLDEDANVGSSIDEFERWKNQNQGKLFFSAPNAYAGRRRMSHVTNDPELQINTNNNNTNSSDVPSNPIADEDDYSYEDDDSNFEFYKKRYFGRGEWNIGRVLFYLQYYLILMPICFVVALLSWLSIFCIPMAKVLVIMSSQIRRHPLALSFEDESVYYSKQLNSSNHVSESFLILTYRSFGIHYYKYTVDGTNIFFINLNVLVIFTILDFFVLKESFGWTNFITNSTTIFGLCLISIIPLAYFIGQAVASISAQTSMGLGAVINAFFSTVVEIYLYCIALDQSKAKLVEGSIIGSILGGVLLLPGGSMCFGAIRRKTQRYNPQSAGVSSTMLLYAILVMLSPTILYEIYGEYKVRCQACSPLLGEECQNCHYYQPSVVIDPLYVNYLRPFTIICALSLFLVYCICLWFTLKTHAALIWSTPINSSTKEKKLEAAGQQPVSEQQSLNSFTLNEPAAANKPKPDISKQPAITLDSASNSKMLQPQQSHSQMLPEAAVTAPSGGHDAPNWSRTKSTTILLTATLLYAIIAEILVDCVDDVLKSVSIDPKFLGLTIFALVPNTTEFVNAFSFAMHGNVALSMEIGSAYALQVCLLQIPFVVLYSVWNFTKTYDSSNGAASLVETATSLPRLTDIFRFSAANQDVLLSPVQESVKRTFGSVSSSAGEQVYVGVDKMFSLIFPHWDFIASLLGVYMFTYIYTEGKSNYFKGSILLFLYIVLISGFYISLSIESVNLAKGLMT